MNLRAGRGVAVREFPTEHGPADYLLYVAENTSGLSGVGETASFPGCSQLRELRTRPRSGRAHAGCSQILERRCSVLSGSSLRGDGRAVDSCRPRALTSALCAALAREVSVVRRATRTGAEWRVLRGASLPGPYGRGMSDSHALRSSPPPRGELFSDPAAAVVWAAIEKLEERGLHELRDRLFAEITIPELRSGEDQVKLARGVSALREAHALAQLEPRADRGRGGAGQRLALAGEPGEVPLSVDTYRLLRGREGRRREWPPDTSLRRWMGGSWNDCLRAAGLAPVADGDALVAEISSRFSRQEVFAAVRAYAQEAGTPIPTLRGVIAWAKRPDVKRRPGRRPESQGPFDRLFPGGWQEVLIAAEFIDAPPGWDAGPRRRRHDGPPAALRVRVHDGSAARRDARDRGASRALAEDHRVAGGARPAARRGG